MIKQFPLITSFCQNITPTEWKSHFLFPLIQMVSDESALPLQSNKWQKWLYSSSKFLNSNYFLIIQYSCCIPAFLTVEVFLCFSWIWSYVACLGVHWLVIFRNFILGLCLLVDCIQLILKLLCKGWMYSWKGAWKTHQEAFWGKRNQTI